MTKSISCTVIETCGDLPDITVRAVQTVVADYLVIRDARWLRRRLSLAMLDVPVGTRESIVDHLADMLQYRSSAKRVWKAAWETLHGGATEEAARIYEVAEDDVDLVLQCMSETTIDALVAVKREEVRDNVHAAEVHSLTQDLKPHVKRVGKRLRFISMYDPAIDKADINQDLMVKALKTVYDYENMVPWEGTSYHTAMLNKARSAASSGALDVIKYNTNPARSRVVGMYMCDGCACTSTAVTPTCTWCGASMERAKRVPQATTYTTNHTRMTVQRGDDKPSAHYVDLAEDLAQQLDPTTMEYLCCLLRESPDFDAWLEETYANTSDTITDSKIRKLAAAYVGEPRKRLDKKLQQAALKARVR